VVGVPKTIDNDLESTLVTFGLDSAVSFATECIDRLHATAQAHRRLIVVEVMGRYAGWIALNCGIAGRSDAILIPEILHVSRRWRITQAENRGGDPYAIVVAAEGAKPIGDVTVKARGQDAPNAWRHRRAVAEQLQQLTGMESRAVVLGHLLRGGSPTSMDRNLGLMFGAAAVRALAEGQSGVMVALNPPRIDYVPLKQAVAKMKTVPPNSNGIITARALEISFGD
jgi:6-phosphofructokinase 1